MKKILLFAAACFLSTAMFAQSTAKISASSLTEGNTSNVYIFELPANISDKDVDAVKDYYLAYFETNFNVSTHKITLTLTSSEPMNRKVMHRLFSSLDVKTFNVDGTEFDFDDLLEKYLQ